LNRWIMKFDIRVDRHTCFFYFVHNMAAWHHSCAPYFNEVWIRETGELTPAEQEALAAFADLVREYPFGDRWIGKSFVLAPCEEQAMEGTRALAGDRARVVLRNAFDAFCEGSPTSGGGTSRAFGSSETVCAQDWSPARYGRPCRWPVCTFKRCRNLWRCTCC
jgi:hypothetical protein